MMGGPYLVPNVRYPFLADSNSNDIESDESWKKDSKIAMAELTPFVSTEYNLL